MNTNQYTQKTLEALQAAQQLAVEYQHNAMEPEHLLHALATQEQGLIPQLLQKLNVDAGSFSAAVAEKLSAMPRVSGSGRDPDKVYISQATDKVLSAAAREAKAMKDDYVSVEHVFLGLLDEPTQNCSDLFRAFSITKDKFLQQLTAVRGNQRVTNDNPEDTYNALQKYGQDLVDLARKQKLDRALILGQRLVAQGKFSEAEEAFREAVSCYRDEHRLFQMIAGAFMEVGQPRRAIDYLRRAVEVEPDNAAARDMLEEVSAGR